MAKKNKQQIHVHIHQHPPKPGKLRTAKLQESVALRPSFFGSLSTNKQCDFARELREQLDKLKSRLSVPVPDGDMTCIHVHHRDKEQLAQAGLYMAEIRRELGGKLPVDIMAKIHTLSETLRARADNLRSSATTATTAPVAD
ncbi:hypothetical protein DB346_08500 [Verrucomicrobia bacterium LW23]|nr:hypothetical protein DB346_08500 [Verrucomicrobia bacterium LW23]